MCVACASDYNYIITHALREGGRAFLVLVNVQRARNERGRVSSCLATVFNYAV